MVAAGSKNGSCRQHLFVVSGQAPPSSHAGGTPKLILAIAERVILIHAIRKPDVCGISDAQRVPAGIVCCVMVLPDRATAILPVLGGAPVNRVVLLMLWSCGHTAATFLIPVEAGLRGSFSRLASGRATLTTVPNRPQSTDYHGLRRIVSPNSRVK